MRTKVSTYLMMFEDLEKVVPNEFNKFKEKTEQCLLVLRLKGYDVNFKDVVLYVQNAESKLYDDYVDADEHIRDEIDEIISETIGSVLLDLQNAFEEKTSFSMYINWSDKKNWLYVDFPDDTTVVVSPQLKRLSDLGAGFVYDDFINI